MKESRSPRMWMVLPWSAMLCLVPLAPLVGAGAATPKPTRAISELTMAAKELARGGRKEARDVVLGELHDLGYPEKRIAKLHDLTDRMLKAGMKDGGAVLSARREIGRAAKYLTSWMGKLPPARRVHAAKLILRLSGSSAVCRRMVGEKEEHGRWVSREAAACEKRHADLEDALRRALDLPVSVDVGDCDPEIFEALYGKKGHVASFGRLSIESVRFSVPALKRMVTQIVRAFALLNYMHSDKLETYVPPLKIIALGSAKDYERAARIETASGQAANWGAGTPGTLGNFEDRKGDIFCRSLAEADVEVGVVYFGDSYLCEDLYGAVIQPCLAVGTENWVCLSVIGAPLGAIAWVQTSGGSGLDTSAAARERRRMLRLSRAGIAGSRAYLEWLVRRNEAPAYSQTMLDQEGRINGKARLEATFMAQYFVEKGLLATVCRKTEVGGPHAASTARAFEAALHEKLPRLEKDFRNWLMPVEPGLCQRLAGPGRTRLSPQQADLLEVLGKIRKRAGLGRAAAVEIDKGASAGCLAHAKYLSLHRKQLAVWPGAHEEYPDKKGFSAAGCRAGLASVIASRMSSAEQAVDEWMGTFYHRLPLLDPGLVRVGWALDHGIAVMDCGSFVAPAEYDRVVVWPPNRSRGMPTHFQPELPDPVPGKSQSGWGYPVTVQVYPRSASVHVTLVLRRGSGPRAAVVPAYVLGPDHGGNPNLPLTHTFGLIPKSPLTPNTEYTITAAGLPGNKKATWTFRTGDR